MDNQSIINTDVSLELQAVLNHLAGPALSFTMDPDVTNQYNRVTWFNSVMYGQDASGTWHRIYLNTEHRVEINLI